MMWKKQVLLPLLSILFLCFCFADSCPVSAATAISTTMKVRVNSVNTMTFDKDITYIDLQCNRTDAGKTKCAVCRDSSNSKRKIRVHGKNKGTAMVLVYFENGRHTAVKVNVY